MKAYGLSTLFLQEKPIIKVLGFKILFRENAFLSPEENASGALFTCVFLFLSSSPHPSPCGIHQLHTTWEEPILGSNPISASFTRCDLKQVS